MSKRFRATIFLALAWVLGFVISSYIQGGRTSAQVLPATWRTEGDRFIVTNRSTTSSLLVFVSSKTDDREADPPERITVEVRPGNEAELPQASVGTVWLAEVKPINLDCDVCGKCMPDGECPIPPHRRTFDSIHLLEAVTPP